MAKEIKGRIEIIVNGSIFEVNVDGFNKMEVLGILRYLGGKLEREILSSKDGVIKTKFEPTNQLTPIEEWIFKQPTISFRLKNVLISLSKNSRQWIGDKFVYKKLKYIEEVTKNTMRRARNAGIKTQKEFEKLRQAEKQE